MIDIENIFKTIQKIDSPEVGDYILSVFTFNTNSILLNKIKEKRLIMDEEAIQNYMLKPPGNIDGRQYVFDGIHLFICENGIEGKFVYKFVSEEFVQQHPELYFFM